jgi:MutS domain V
VSRSPGDEYRVRLDARGATHAALIHTDLRFSQARLTVFGVLFLLAVLAWPGVVSAWWLLAPALALAALIQRHDRVVHAREAAARAVAFYERGLARIEDRWLGTGTPGDRFTDDRHLYANDLDLFGRGSLFELLALTRTRAGEDALAGWLKAPAAPSEILERQQAITELTDSLDFREAISVVGTEAASIRSDWLVAWAEGPPVLSPRWFRYLAWAITAVFVVTLVLWLTTGNSTPMTVVLGIQIAFAWPQQKRVERVSHGADTAARDLDTLGELLHRLERESFTSPRLVALRRLLDTEGLLASRAIHALHRLVELHDWQHNLYFLIPSLLFMWGTHVAWAMEEWRHSHGRHLRLWFDAVGEFEAFSSLSAYRFEHPDDPFPEIVEPSESARAGLFDARGLGHPLLSAARSVRNDVACVSPTQLLVVSGSNMSGKSTLLRTVGINTVLALAGAPVRAHSLRLSPLAVGATLRIQDSLQEGRSRFYAEITRIREIADVARGPTPLLFLLDELFHGTNSHDRLVGSSGVLRSLLDRGAIGLITTHDLALTGIARALSPRSVNVHFEDWFDGQELQFDYRLKTGPVTRSNAIALMRAVGLDVPEEQ